MRSRPGIGRAAAALVACVLATLLVTAPGLGAQTPDPDTTDPDLLTITLVDQTTWLDPDGEIGVSFSLSGDLPDGASIEVTLHERVTSRADFAATLERRTLRGRLTDPPVVVAVPDEGDTADVQIPIRSGPPDPDEEEPRLGIADPGVHPVDIAVYDADRTLLASVVTHVVRPPLDAPDDQLGVVPVVVFDAPPGHRADGTVAVDTASKARWAAAVETLDDLDLPFVTTVRPETVVALQSSEAALDRRLLDDLDRLLGDRATLATSSYVAVQPDALLRADLGADLDRSLERGADILREELEVDPSPDLWIAMSGLSTAGLDALVERGIDRIVVDGRLLESAGDEPAAEPGRPSRLTTSTGTIEALVTDPLLASHLGSTGDPVRDLNRLMADLAVTWFTDDDPGSVALLLPPLDQVDPTTIDALAQGIDASPLVTVRSLEAAWSELHALDLEGTRPIVGSLAADRDPSDLSGLRRDLDLTRLTIASVDSVFTDADDLTDALDDRLAVVISSDLDDNTRTAYHREIAGEVDELLSGLDIPERRAITLPARDGTIPLTVNNTTDRTMEVAVALDSDKLTFVDGERITVSVPPGTHTVDIEVSARASGVFPLEVLIESPDGNIEMATARYTIRSAAVSGVGVALSVAAVAVLGVWWFRTSRRARAAHRAAQEDTGESARDTPER